MHSLEKEELETEEEEEEEEEEEVGTFFFFCISTRSSCWTRVFFFTEFYWVLPSAGQFWQVFVC